MTALIAALVCTATIRAQDTKTYIYVGSDVGKPRNANSIFTYVNDGLGNLTAVPGSPFLTGGTGVASNGGGRSLMPTSRS